VDWGTAGGFRIAYFQKFGPTLLLFYVGYPLVFSILAFRLRWSERRLFVATLAAIFLVEVVFVENPLLTTFPALLAGIPLAVAIYTPLTYFPLWFVRGDLARHRRLIVVLIVVDLVVMTLTAIGNAGP
jgi:hypothetical protein